MRYTDFKLVESKVKQPLTEVSKMSKSNWKATSETTPVKYVNAVAKSIAKKSTFTYMNGKTEMAGIVDKIIVDGNEMSPEDWNTFALNSYPAFVTSTKFIIDGEEVALNTLLKNEAVKGSLVPNKGDIAEAILGSAIAAKFAVGGRNVTTNDVVKVLKQVVAAGVAEGTTDYQKANIQDDNYKFTLTLNNSSMKPLELWMSEADPMASPKDFRLVTEFEVLPAVVASLQLQIKHAVEYANKNQRATTAVDKAKLDPKDNTIEIISDGGDATQQTSTKVDLKLKFDSVPQRLLSLKAGAVKQFGQVSGGEWNAVSNFFESIFKFRLPDSMKDEFGFKSSNEDDYKAYNYGKGPFAKLYNEMAKQVTKYTAGDNTAQEYKLVQHVYDAINYHATRGEEGVTMVILSPTAKIAYKELAFDARLLAALELYDLQVVNDAGLKNHRISIVGVLKADVAKATLGKAASKISSKAVLVQLRTAMQGGAIRNIVEMGDLLKELANVEKLDKVHTTNTQAAQKPPVADTKAASEPTADDINSTI